MRRGLAIGLVFAVAAGCASKPKPTPLRTDLPPLLALAYEALPPEIRDIAISALNPAPPLGIERADVPPPMHPAGLSADEAKAYEDCYVQAYLDAANSPFMGGSTVTPNSPHLQPALEGHRDGCQAAQRRRAEAAARSRRETQGSR